MQKQAIQNEKEKMSIKEFIQIILIALAIAFLIKYFLFQPFYVKGASMEPNFYNHEYLIVNKVIYRLNNPQRGDVVVFKYPKSSNDFYIKRIIGLPEEKVKIIGKEITIYNKENPNGKVFDENKFLPEQYKMEKDVDVTLGNDEYFVLGDNRAHSFDSSAESFGSLERKFIIGKTWIRAWPFNKFTIFKNDL
ncbi:MAG: signal peptidase I [Patescibacteria group bacterium]